MKKKIFFGVLLVVVVCICVTRWDTWFGNPPEPGYDIQHHPSRVLLTVGPDGNSRYVSWQCDSLPQPGWLDYAKEGSSDTITLAARGEVFHSRSGVGAYFSVLLDSLDYGTSYVYRVRVGSDTSAWFRFPMPKISDTLTFLSFGDIQDDMGDEGFDSLLPLVMRSHADASFLLFSGDLIERPMDQYWGKVFNSLSSYATSVPVVAVPGNHEYLKGVVRELEPRFTYVFPYFESTSPSDNALFSYKMGDVRFFLLDSNKDVWNFCSQRAWLKKQLADCKEKWKVVVLHHPVISITGSFNNLFVRWFFDDLIREYGVDLVLQGHEHAYARFSVPESESSTEPLRLVSYCSRKDYPIYFHGDVAKWGTDDRYFQKIRVTPDTLSLETFNSALKLYDKVSIVKKDGARKYVDEGFPLPEKVCVSEWFRQHKSKKKVRMYEESIEKWRRERDVKN